MTKTRCNLSISLDGYLAGPNQSLEHPLGVGGTRLHEWAFALSVVRKQFGGSGGEANASTQVYEEALANIGAVVMGRNMFGGGRGPWCSDPAWTGWWGDTPPYGAPVFVVTHHAREPVEMQGGTTFHFVTDGVEAAHARARAVAGDRDISIAGGAAIVQQCLARGLLDEINLSISPVLLGAGERLFDQLGPAPIALQQVRVIDAPGVTHIRYRRVP